MKYAHILSAFAAEPWAMQPEKLGALTRFLAFKAAGGVYSAEEVAAVIDRAKSEEIARKEGAVGVIPVYGVLSQRMGMMSEMSGGTSYQALARSLHQAIADPEIKAIVLDIDSPGGSVPGTEELGAEIRRLRGGDKPIIAQVNSLAASAAYWIAASADEVVVTPSGRAGSIGVYTVHDDVSKALAEEGVTRTYISSTPEKVEGNETEPLSKDAQAFIQERVNRSYDRFVAAVADGRGVSKSKVLDGFGKGRVFFAEELLDRGMADSIATLDETLFRFGASTAPEPVRRLRASNSSRAEAANELAAKMRTGEPITKREFENGLKGLVGLSNSEAERAARLYLKTDQGAPDETDAAALAALDRLLAEANTPIKI
jgi:signal peptide peptidase SppA